MVRAPPKALPCSAMAVTHFAHGLGELRMKKATRPAILAVLCCAFLLTACSGEKAAPPAPPPPLVTIFAVESKNHPYPVEYQAVTQGSKAVEVRARVEAIIEKRLYTEGDYVKEGQMLFQLERDQYEARVQEAEAQYNMAKREWDRIRPLYEKNAVSQKDRDSARAAFETAQANLRTAQINLGYCQVTSPVSGYTGKENFTPGNLVGNNSLLTSVNQTDPLYVNFAFAGPDYMRRQQLMAQGRLLPPPDNTYTAHIRLLNGAMYDKPGKVTFIDTQVDQATGVVKARAEFPNENEFVLPGQYVRIFVEGAVLKDAILIPQKAVLMTQMGTLVMVVGENDVVQVRPVKLNAAIGEMYLVDEGLKSGERIVLEGLVKSRPGQPVRIQQPAAPGQGGQQGQPPAKAGGQAQK